jgi:predicted AlkP superfamily phosphohydrolase/phosphomutase
MMKHRTLIIGLDGATFDLIHPWVQSGYLPTFARLMAQGVHTPLQAWPNMNSAVAWSSIVTGYNPGQHGIFSFGDAPPQHGTKWRPMIAADRQKDPFWRLLSASGQYVGIINVPISYPADPVNGFMLAGMDTPGLRSPKFAHPPHLLNELYRERINYIIDVPNLGELSRRNPYHLPELVNSMMKARSRAILYLMRTRPWDLMMVVFVATDRVQHCYWPGGNVSLEDTKWNPIRSLYQQIDSFFRDAIELFDKNTTVLVVSDHGFGPMHLARRCLNPLFAQLGLLHYHQGGIQWQGKFLETLLLHGRRIIPPRFQSPLSRVLPKLTLHAKMEFKFSGIKWSQTQVFADPFDGQIFINLQGREPEGIVSVEEYYSLCERVQNIMLKLRDPESGAPLVKAVYRPEDLYHGPYTKATSDLVIEWDDEVLGDDLFFDGEGKPIIIKAPKKTSFGSRWKGSHRPYGIFIAYGPHIKKGATLSNATLYDIAPTILYLQDHSVPKDMDGRVLTDIFTEEHLHNHPIQYCEPPDTQWKGPKTELDAEETRKIEERLRGLGYIE